MAWLVVWYASATGATGTDVVPSVPTTCTGRKKVKQRIQTHHTDLVDLESVRRWRHPHTTVHIYVKTLPTGDEAGFTVQNHWTIDYLHFL